MSTKVISAKLSSDDYDKLIAACNNKGSSISEFVRERCLEFLDKKLDESTNNTEENSTEESKQNEISELKGKIFLLELELSFAKDRVDKLNKRIDEFLELFTPQEISNRKICKAASNFNKKYCVKL